MTDQKPLNVRCAEALGWSEFRSPFTFRVVWHGRAPDGVLHSEVVPPYGDDTPEGWACTGPLIGRFGLSVISPTPVSPAWGCLIIDTDRISMGAHACAAVAEWVAEHVTNGEVKP